MGYVIFRGISTSTNETIPASICSGTLNNIYVSRMPNHRKAAQRYTEYYVNGRDGALHVDEGLSNFDITVTLVLLNSGADARQVVNAWADGTGRLVLSDDLTKAFMASVKEEVEWVRVKADGFIRPFISTETYTAGEYVRYNGIVYKFTNNHTGSWNDSHVEQQFALVDGLFAAATVTFNCQPYMVESVVSEILFDVPGETSMITNPGSAEALPFIEVNGSGDATFSINGSEITIAGMTENVPVYLDSSAGYVYTAEGATSMTGDFPVLVMGQNTISLGAGVSSLLVKPNWRWI